MNSLSSFALFFWLIFKRLINSEWENYFPFLSYALLLNLWCVSKGHYVSFSSTVTNCNCQHWWLVIYWIWSFWFYTLKFNYLNLKKKFINVPFTLTSINFHFFLLLFGCISGSGVSSGVNFAIPIDTVVRSVPSLIVYGTPYSNRFWPCMSLSVNFNYKLSISFLHSGCTWNYHVYSISENECSNFFHTST